MRERAATLGGLGIYEPVRWKSSASSMTFGLLTTHDDTTIVPSEIEEEADEEGRTGYISRHGDGKAH